MLSGYTERVNETEVKWKDVAKKQKLPLDEDQFRKYSENRLIGETQRDINSKLLEAKEKLDEFGPVSNVSFSDITSALNSFFSNHFK